MAKTVSAATFEGLEFRPHPVVAGEQATVAFDNRYGASVIRTPYSYGGDRGLYELAVLHDGVITYKTPLTEDVLGYLSPDAVTAALEQIAALPARVHA